MEGALTVQLAGRAGVFCAGADGRCEFASSQWLCWAGLSREEALGLHWVSILHPADRERIRREWEARQARGEEFCGEGRLRAESNDGSKDLRVVIHTVPSMGEKGAHGDCLGVVYSAPASIAPDGAGAEDGTFCWVFKHSPVAIGISDPETGRYLQVNPAFEKLTGYSAEQAVGRTSLELGIWISPEQRAHLIERLQREKFIQNELMSLRAANGTMRRILVSAEILQIEGVARLLIIASDVSDLLQTRYDLERSESEVQAIIEALPDAVALFNREGRLIEHFDNSSCRFPFIWQSGADLQIRRIFSPGIAESFALAHEAVFQSREPQIFEFESTDENTSIHHYEARMVLCGADRVVCVLRDITKEAQLLRKSILQERATTVGQTLSMLTHCLRNVFTALSGSVGVLGKHLNEEDLATAREAWAVLNRSSMRLYMMISEMMDYTKSREPDLQNIDLQSLVDEVIEHLQVISPDSIVMESEVALKARFVKLDPLWMFRILINLGHNALEAMENGGQLWIQADMQTLVWPLPETGAPEPPGPSQPGRLALVIEVGDTGTGIEPHHFQRLFEPLFSTKGLKGTGLGLPCVKEFTERMGGVIRVQTEPGHGTVFTLYFPQ